MKAVAAKKSIGVQHDKSLESKTGDILVDLTLKQVEMIVQKTVKEVLKHDNLHLYTSTLDASQFQSVVDYCLEKILEEKRSQNLHVTRSDDNKSVPKYIDVEIRETTSQSPVALANDDSLFKDSSSAPIISKIGPAHAKTPSSKEYIVTVQSTISSIHIISSENDLQSHGPSKYEIIVPSQHPTVNDRTVDQSLPKCTSLNDRTVDQSLPKCTSSMESQKLPLPSWNAQSHTEVITSHASKEGIVNVPSTISSIHIMPSEYDLPSYGSSVGERMVPSPSHAANCLGLEKSLTKGTSSRKSQNVPLPTWNAHSHNKINTSSPSTKGIVNVPSTISSIHIMPSEDNLLSYVPSTISSIHIMPSEEYLLSYVPSTISSIHIMPSDGDLPSYGPSICEKIVPSLTPPANAQTQDKWLPKCTSSRNITLPFWNAHSHSKINTSSPSTKGIVNVPSTISSIHIMPSEDGLLSSVPSTISSIHIIPSEDDLPSCGPSVCENIVPSITPAANGPTLDTSLSKFTSPRESLIVPLPSWNTHSHNKIITSPSSTGGIVNVPSTISSIHIMSSEDDLPSYASICESIVPSLTPPANAQTQDRSLPILMNSHNVPLSSWHTHGHNQQIISSAFNCHMNQTSSGVYSSMQSVLQSERDHQNGSNNCTHWYVFKNYLRELFIPGALIILHSVLLMQKMLCLLIKLKKILLQEV